LRNKLKKHEKREREKNVMSDNQSVTQGKVLLKETLKQQEINAFRDYKLHMDTDEHKRQQERHERETRIKMLINRTTNVTVEHQAQQQELEIDRKVREAQEKREQFEKMLELKKREDRHRQHDELKQRLEVQVQEKRHREMLERAHDDEYHKMQVQKLQHDDEIERAKVHHRKQKHQEFKNNLLLQMGQLNNSQTADIMSQMSPSSVGGAILNNNNRKKVPMEAMT